MSRKRAGLTVVELSGRVGSKYPDIVAMEQDRRSIGLKMARKLSDALGCHRSSGEDIQRAESVCHY